MKEGMKFRKRPIIIEAIQWLGDNRVEVAKFMNGGTLEGINEDLLFPGNWIIIRTNRGCLMADPGDWIVRGVEGDYYPVNPVAFWKTYVSVTDTVEGP